MKEKFKEGFLSGSQLKLVALVAMTVDHIGYYLFPDADFLRIIGRLAFPIFAYMIAEGCRYTRNRKKYLLTIALLGLGCQLVTFVAARSLFQCILITFSLSIGLTFLFDNAKSRKTISSFLWLGVGIGTVLFLTDIAPRLLSETDYAVDYGFCGVFLPVAIFVAGRKRDKLIFMTAVLCLIALDYGNPQWFSLGAVPFLAFYNGKRGNAVPKNLFYVYYPLHIGAIILIDVLMKAV
ncbi:MAG: hypothetical protein E7412_01120 [Ruminococcaceae bacterium]|nr:hypothetical protein [Oscillospiraceae bacterium]